MYNGLGARVAVSVAGQMTRYTLDHAARNRILAESTPTHTVLYLYSGGGTGTDVCLGEIRAGVPRYYLPDAAGYVRQGVDTDGAVASSWLFDPDGTVLEGPDGPVSHLVCGGVYDSSTGLLYQGGSYFDPRLGIWLALLPLVVLQAWPGRKKKKYNGTLWGILLIGIAGGMLTACGNDGEDLLKFGEEICAEMPSVDYKLSVKLPEPQVYNGEYWGDPEMWQARLGNKQNATLETGCDNNAVLILGEVTTDPPISSAPGYIRFEQHVSYQHIYHFGKSDRQTTDSITAGDLNTWYIDGGESPYLDSDGTKTGN